MLNHSKLFLLFLILSGVFIFIGCQEEQSVVAPDLKLDKTTTTSFTLPSGVSIESAKLKLFQFSGNNKTLNVYRVTSPWDEYVVTWNNFGGAYDPLVIASFTTDPAFNDDTLSIDITNLVRSWVNCTSDNYGILIDQVETSGDPEDYSDIASKENTNPVLGAGAPHLEIVLSNQDTILLVTIGDTKIDSRPGNVNTNYGTQMRLYPGYVDGFKKQALIQFEINCTPSQCYQEETAWAANGNQPGSLRYTTRGNWATYLASPSSGSKTVNIYAGQNIYVGTATITRLNGNVDIDITLEGGWELNSAKSETVKIQGYTSAPSGNPAPGKFTTYKGNALVDISAPYFNFYGIHLDVRKSINCP